MIELKRHRLVALLTMVLIAAAAIVRNGQLAAARPAGALLAPNLQVPSPKPADRYEVRTVHDPDGIGRFYLDREIARVMGPSGMPWLDRPEREVQEQPEAVLRAMGLQQGQVVADLGAGTGYFTFRLASKVGKTGKVLAVDIQDEMLDALRQRAMAMGITNVEEVKGTETDPKLPANTVDRVLMVDVYHELAYPFEVMTKVCQALKPTGRVVFVEYRKEDPRVPIKELHKMSIEQLTKEMIVVGLVRVQTVESLPSQHIVIFGKHE